MYLSFCIVTEGKRIKKTKLCIESIYKNLAGQNNYEIIVVGNNISKLAGKKIKLVEMFDSSNLIGKKRNLGVQKSNGDIIIHCDDDIILDIDWFEKFKQFNKKNKDWLICSNKILLPSGNRFWDRAIIYPNHKMVPYDYLSNEAVFYQTGGFSISKIDLFSKVSWADEIPYYATEAGFKYNEDIDFSLKLKDLNINIDFDSNNKVWHFDYKYISNDHFINRCSEEEGRQKESREFKKLIENLKK